MERQAVTEGYWDKPKYLFTFTDCLVEFDLNTNSRKQASVQLNKGTFRLKLQVQSYNRYNKPTVISECFYSQPPQDC